MSLDNRLFSENASYSHEATWKVQPIGRLSLESGDSLESVEIAYETWGELNPQASNAVLVCHALSGDSHCVGWWSRLVGPGRLIDPAKYFIIGSNVLGGCRGSTGPGSLGPDGSIFGSNFPAVSIEDMVSAQQTLLKVLGVHRPRLVCGGSMGGMQALEWARRDACELSWLTASAAAHSPMQIGFNEVARQAIYADPKWNGGDYAQDDPPNAGLAVGRMLGHLTYLSPTAFDEKFGRRQQEGQAGTFEVESYLRYQGQKFTQRFDARSLVVLTKAIDRYECRSLKGSGAKLLLTSFTSDWIYPVSQSQAAHEMALASGCESEHHVIDVPYGHDAFLLDDQQQVEIVQSWLAQQ